MIIFPSDPGMLFWYNVEEGYFGELPHPINVPGGLLRWKYPPDLSLCQAALSSLYTWDAEDWGAFQHQRM